jgi:hypothetical protein
MLSNKREMRSKSELKTSKKLIKNKGSIKSNSNDRNKLRDDDEQEFPIELIITRRINRKRIEYLVKWQGYDYTECTWETLQNLIEDNCFEKLFDYENLSIDEKISLLNKYKKVKALNNKNKLKKISEKTITQTEKYDEVTFFRNNYNDFNPLFKDKLKKWEYGNLDDDSIDFIIPYQRNKKEGIIYKCFWKKRRKEKEPRKPRYYSYYVIKSVDATNFHTAFNCFDHNI